MTNVYTLRNSGKELSLSEPRIMGILNATPNSFFNRGKDSDTEALLRNAVLMVEQGAAILDIGGASTKQGEPISAADDEIGRVIPAIEAIRKALPDVWISVDTYHAKVAAAAVAAGADIVNDVSAGNIDTNMLTTVAGLHVPYIAMHMQGTPETMQHNPQYSNVVAEMRRFFVATTDKCNRAGIEQIILDPGFGFGKTVRHNFALLNYLSSFGNLGYPILAGLSRKSMVCKPLGVNPDKALNGTTALNMAALLQGAHLLRVHDVKEAKETITLFKEMEGAY